MAILSSGQITKEYSGAQAWYSDLKCFFWVLIFYSSFMGFALDYISFAIFSFVAPVALLRNYNCLHQLFHSKKQNSSPFRVLRFFPIIVGPLQLGYVQFKKNHLDHHRYDGSQNDPELYLQQGPPIKAFLTALTQPEQSAVRYIKYNGWKNWSLVLCLASYLLFYLSVLAVFGWEIFLIYNAVARIANGLFFWISDFWMHHPRFYPQILGNSFPAFYKWSWVALYGIESWNGVTQHTLHHTYPLVQDIDLPRLSLQVSKAHST